ncbi:MAG: outer membrane beta-barrel protein [Sediminibacterium sp.]
MKFTFAAIIACLFTICVQAQSGNISGKITDSSGKKTLPLTTITIFKAKDTTIVTYRLSNETGEFKIPGLPFDVPLRLMATYSGYEAFRKDFVLTAAQPSVNFGNVKLTGTSKQLDEVIVMSERPPVVIKKDTIEFNASAFKTLPTALLEDLLKKLPGIAVDENGDISVNGQKVNRILVDGKRFFGDDPKMATRNLPSNLVDKVQVMDDKDEIALNNDGDLSRIGKVVNVTLKKGIKKALFGKLYAGGGTNDRYEIGGIVNTFRDTLQMSIMAFSNNINRMGFSIQDVTSLGGFNRSGFNSMSMSSSSGGRETFSINNISFGGGGQGITKSNGGGFNLNHSPSKDFSFFAQYFYGGTKSDELWQTTTQRFFGDTVLFSKSSGSTISHTGAHTLNAGGNWRKDSLTNLTFNGGFTYNTNDRIGYAAGYTDNTKIGPVSSSSNMNNVDGNSTGYNYYVSLTHRFAGKKARNISFNHNFNYTRNPVDNINESINNYSYPSSGLLVVQQLRTTNSPSTNGSFGINYSDRLSPKLTLRFNERIEYSNQAQLVAIYAKHGASGFYDSLNTTLSNDFRREHVKWNNQLTLSYTVKEVTFNFGTSLYEQWVSNQFAKGASSKQHYSNILFNTGFNWKRINVSLSTGINPPSINYLNPVTDNSNPFYIVYGNPNLRPSTSTNLNIFGNVANVKTNVTYNFNVNAGTENDAVIQALTVNAIGAYTTTPINVDGMQRIGGSFSVNKQFKKNLKFIFSGEVGIGGTVNHTPMMFNNVASTSNVYSVTPRVRFTFNWNDVVEFNPSAYITLRKNTYSSKQFSATDYTGQNLQAEFIVRLPKKFVWETNVNYRYTSNLAAGLPKANVYWNAALTFLMFNQDKGQLKVAVYDILNSNNNVNRYINTNVITDSRSNVLQRYFMLTYSYNIRSLTGQKAKVGGRQNMFLF